jgi:hypothetical protein
MPLIVPINDNFIDVCTNFKSLAKTLKTCLYLKPSISEKLILDKLVTRRLVYQSLLTFLRKFNI